MVSKNIGACRRTLTRMFRYSLQWQEDRNTRLPQILFGGYNQLQKQAMNGACAVRQTTGGSAVAQCVSIKIFA